MGSESLARTYYRAIDEDEYATLESVLAPSFVHERPDRTLEGPDRFVRFMREERPRTETTHIVDALYTAEDEITVRGRLLSEAGEELFAFVDVFSVADGAIAKIRTFTQ